MPEPTLTPRAVRTLSSGQQVVGDPCPGCFGMGISLVSPEVCTTCEGEGFIDWRPLEL